MPLLTVILVLLAVGVLLWAINTYAAQVLDAKILKIINFVAILIVILWLLKIFGVWAYIAKVSV